jgi:hypothetical protein
MESKEVQIKEAKLTKATNRYYLHIPAFLIKNGDLDPEKTYTITFVESGGSEKKIKKSQG